ncbi:PQQ-binding-like beta-propeller repeat protein [Terasakiella brassicae]|nr:PQQ-binding-like beta-propeller repeat protein [Terasakiella brassicae]
MKQPETPNMMRRFLMAGLCVLSLSACDTWLGEKEASPLPGERISVLLHERTLDPDPETAAKEILLPPPSPNMEWPQAGGFANHAMHHIEVAPNLHRIWRTSIGSGSDDSERIVAQPIVADGKIFTVDSENLVSAFNAETGQRLWELELTPEYEDDGHISGGLAYENGRLYVATGFALVFGIEANTGKTIWVSKADAPMRAAPTARGNRLFVITLNNELIAFDGRNGEKIWNYKGISETASILGGASPAVDQGVVVAAFSSGDIVALKVENGTQVWTDSLTGGKRLDAVSALTAIRGRPVIDRGRVYAISNSGSFTAIDLTSGRRYWSKELSSQETPWIAGDYLYVVTPDSELVCVSRYNGRIHWVTQLPRWQDPEERTGNLTWSAPILVSNRLIVAGSNEEAYSVSPYTGEILGKVDMPDKIIVPPLAANGALYFLSDDADLVAYR